MTEAGLIAARFAHYVALVLVFGAFAYASFGDESVSVSRRLVRLGLGSSVLLLLAAGAVLAATIAGLGGGFASLSDTTLWSAVVEETDFGRVWSVRLFMASALVVVGLALWRWPSRALSLVGLLLASALVITVALTGHAATGEGLPGLVHRAADAAHLVAAAVWLGALPPLLFLLGRDASGATENPAVAAGRLRAFHSIGLTSVLALVLTGVVNSWFLMESPARLVTTTYGVVLSFKLVLFALMVGLAADNLLRLVPAFTRDLARRLGDNESTARLRSRIRAELALGVLVMLAVSALGAIAPAAA